jgi:hypothetical protein
MMMEVVMRAMFLMVKKMELELLFRLLGPCILVNGRMGEYLAKAPPNILMYLYMRVFSLRDVQTVLEQLRIAMEVNIQGIGKTAKSMEPEKPFTQMDLLTMEISKVVYTTAKVF